MTTRPRKRRHSRAPERAALLAAGLLLAYLAALAVAHVLGWLLATATLAAAAWIAGQRKGRREVSRTCSAGSWQQAPRDGALRPEPSLRRVADAGQLARVTAERDQLGAQVADLARQLAEARDSAHAAWDAAARPPPRPDPEPEPDDDTGGRRAALLAQPLSGVRPLTPH